MYAAPAPRRGRSLITRCALRRAGSGHGVWCRGCTEDGCSAAGQRGELRSTCWPCTVTTTRGVLGARAALPAGRTRVSCGRDDLVVSAHLDVTTVIATAALFVSLGAALWQYIRWRLEGGRIWVRLFPGALHEYSLRRDSSWNALAQRIAQRNFQGVVSRGRYRRGGEAFPYRGHDLRGGLGVRTSHTGASPPHGTQSLDARAPGASTDEVTRLEPFDRRVFVFDVWQVLQPIMSHDLDPPRPSSIRASVRVAGRRGYRRSPWRRRWRGDGPSNPISARF